MKNIAIVVLLVFTISLGAFSWHQRNQIAQIQTQLAAVQNQLKEKSGADEKVARAEQKSKILQNTLAETSKFADEKSKQAETVAAIAGRCKNQRHQSVRGICSKTRK